MTFVVMGNVEARVFKECRGLKEIIHKYTRNVPLINEERRVLESYTAEKVTVNNLLMERMADRFSGVFSNSPTIYFDSSGLQTDPDIFQNMLGEITALAVGTSAEAGWTTTPELIGIGTNTTSVSKTQRGLVTQWSTGFRNTWNTREGGTNPTVKDNYVLRCAAEWDTTFGGAGSAIREVGLFFPQLLLARRPWAWNAVTTQWEIDITRGGASGNRAWTVFNMSEISDNTSGGGNHVGPPGTAGILLKTYREYSAAGPAPAGNTTFQWNRTSQLLVYNGPVNVANEPYTTNITLFSFTPRYDQTADAVQGSNVAFAAPPTNANLTGLPQMYARVVLPTTITKDNTTLMSIIWLIYVKEI